MPTTIAPGDLDATASTPHLSRRHLFSRASIQSRLLLMLLATSVLSAAIVGFIGYQSGHESLRESVFDRLTEIREAQTRTLGIGVADLKDSLVIYSRGATATQALQDFTAGFDQLADATINPQQQQRLTDYYTGPFAQKEKEQTGNEIDVAALLPYGNAQRYLQALYTTPFTDDQQSILFDDAGDRSAWSAANAKYNDFFREIVTRFKYEDALLIDTRGNIVYTANKGVELGSNILSGPYKGGNLTEAYVKAMQSNAVDYVAITDFGEYQPAPAPTAWLVSPVGDAGRATGVLAMQFPISKINRLMTVDKQWEASGMGRTGETYIVGPDGLMRSDSRLFVEDREAFKRAVIEAGTPPEVAEDSLRQNGTTLVQPVDGPSADSALRGERGTVVTDDYLGQQSLQAYGPVEIEGLHWGVIAEIDTAEAFAPVSAFTRTLVLSTAAIIFVVSIAAMLLARFFVRPIRRLEAGARQISSGDYGVTVPVLSRDEFGDLTVAFNDMSRNLAIKEDLLNEQRSENDRIMLSLMPETAVARYRDGEETISQDHQDVSVIFADIVGLEELSAELSSEESLAIVNRLVRQFDAAADSLGVEHIRTLHNGYLASCGLNVPRLDNVRRTVDFAMEMQLIVNRFNGETGSALTLRAGIDTGTVTSGLVGRSTLAYDMWGATVDLANRVQTGSDQGGIYVTARVYDALGEEHRFVQTGEVVGADGAEPVWRLVETQP